MAQAAPDPGNGPIPPSHRRMKRADTIIPIPAGTGLMPGAVWVRPLPTTSASPSSSASAASSGPPSGSGNPTSAATSSMSLSLRSSGSVPLLSSAVASSGFVPAISSAMGSSGIVPPMSTFRSSVASATASLAPDPHPMASASSGVDISISINDNQTIYVDSPEYGAAGYGWWSCSEGSEPKNVVQMMGGSGEVVMVPEYEAGTCVVGVTVMEYVFVIGGVLSTETQCLTTYDPCLSS